MTERAFAGKCGTRGASRLEFGVATGATPPRRLSRPIRYAKARAPKPPPPLLRNSRRDVLKFERRTPKCEFADRFGLRTSHFELCSVAVNELIRIEQRVAEVYGHVAGLGVHGLPGARCWRWS